MSIKSGLYRGKGLKLIKETERWGHFKNLGIWRILHWMLISLFGNNGDKGLEMRLYYYFIMVISDLLYWEAEQWSTIFHWDRHSFGSNILCFVQSDLQGGSCPTITFIQGSGETKWEGHIHSCSWRFVQI